MIKKILKTAVGILLIPFAVSLTISFAGTLSGVTDGVSAGSTVFFIGAIVYILLHIFVFKPMYLYALCHEAIHALATWLSGGRVKSFRVGSGEGAVETTKVNTFISLCPYFIPSLTIIVSVLYFAIPFFVQIQNLKTIYLFLAGYTLALHLAMTAEALRSDQPDITKTGYFFSIVLIYIANMALVGFVVSLLFKDIQFLKFMQDAYILSKGMYVRLFNQLFKI